MEENFKNRLGFFTFFLVVFVLAIGGFFLTDYLLKEPSEEKENENNKTKIDYRIDKKEDYIYFVNKETISEGAEIYYQDVVINIKGLEYLTDTLEKENKIYKNNIKYLSDMELLSEELINFNHDNLYALTFRNYKIYEYDRYISLVIDEHNYSCFDMNTFIGTKSYIFDIEEGKLLKEEEIFKLYDLNIDIIKNKIRENLVNNQKVVDELELIKIDETLENLKYSLYINDYGKLYISFLVKTTQVDYNEIMEV